MQITSQCCGAVHSAGLENVDQVAACQYDDRMSVLGDLPGRPERPDEMW
jgi:hypothetical protein